MSKERELLKECRLILDTPFNGSTGINLRNRIAELLAQPEQPEPVYWENEKKALLNEIDHLTELLAKPEKTEQTPDYYLWFDEVHEEHPTNEGDDDVMPLYTSPPKRKPIFNYTAPDYITGEYLEAYDLGFSDAEKAHGIGVDDEII